MFNRIRISTTLFLILILCGVLQIGSNGLSFWAFRDGFQNLNQVERVISNALRWPKPALCYYRPVRPLIRQGR